MSPSSASPSTGVSASAKADGDKRGAITIVLNMRPQVAADVPFELADGGTRKFALVDDTANGRSNTRTFKNLKPGTYAVTMTSAPDGPLTQILCDSNLDGGDITTDLANRTATIPLDAGESVVCTFVDGWEPGDIVGYPQVSWGSDPSIVPAAALLVAEYDSVYAATSGVLEVGIPGTAGFSMRFTSAIAVVDYLPAIGPNGALTSDLIDPTSSSSGAFGGEVVALKLNIDFSSLTGGTWNVAFGTLILCNMDLAALNGTTVEQFAGLVNALLGGGSTAFTIGQLAPITAELNAAFGAGQPSTFAQDHLFIGACP